MPEVGITAHDATISFRIPAEGADRGRGPSRDRADRSRSIRERFGDLIVGEGADDVRRRRWSRELRAHGADARHRRVVHRRPGRPPDHGDRRRQPVLSRRRRQLRQRRPRSTCSASPPTLIEAHGAVSPEVAEAMAAGSATPRRRPRPERHRRRRPLGRDAREAGRPGLSRPGHADGVRSAGSTSAPSSPATSSGAGRPSRR